MLTLLDRIPLMTRVGSTEFMAQWRHSAWGSWG